jgi:hypothetical protein
MTAPDDRVEVQRHADRGTYDRGIIFDILDEALYCTVGFVHEGRPMVIPTIHVRVGDRIVLHGSPASRMLRTLKEGAEAAVAVTLLDGLVLAPRSSILDELPIGRDRGRRRRSDEGSWRRCGITEDPSRPMGGRRRPVTGNKGAHARHPDPDRPGKIRSGPPSDGAEDLALGGPGSSRSPLAPIGTRADSAIEYPVYLRDRYPG